MPRFPSAAVSLIIVAVIILLAVLLSPKKSIVDYTISTDSTSCFTQIIDPATGEETRTEIEIRAEGNSIVIIAPIETPNPCYSVVGDVKLSGRDIMVDLSAVSSQQICIQCTGEVTGKVVIQNLTKGIYGVKVTTPYKAAITTITIG